MIQIISILIAIGTLLVAAVCNITSHLINKNDVGIETEEVQIIARRIDEEGNKYVTFETVTGLNMEMLVPEQMYEIAVKPVIGHLTYESNIFVRFVQNGTEVIKNFYSKDYRSHTKKGLSRI